jgi:hypothetical protein
MLKVRDFAYIEVKARARITQLVPSDLRSLGAIHTKTSVTDIEEV